ncbi:MAG: glycosyltransferase family 4 protein [Verrucomicrobiota bacterium]
MRVAHLLRKYNPGEWGGTETAVKRLFDGLHYHGVESIAFCPRINSTTGRDPFVEAGFKVNRFDTFVPVLGISNEQKAMLISTGGNLMSFSAIWSLLREKNVSLIHTHTHNRLGGIALTVARTRKIPLVTTIHGGVLDLPATVKQHLLKPLEGGLEWGKIFGLALRSRRVLQESDAIITCNKKEAALLNQKSPRKRVLIQPHGVPADEYQKASRAKAREAFPQIVGRQLLLSVGRIDTVKNQGWLVEQAATVIAKHPNAIFVLAGSCTDFAYGKSIEREIQKRNLGERVLLTGGLPPGDPRLIGLFQEAEVLLLPSISETFGLVILESWAAGTPVISSRTSGALDMVIEGKNGWLFDLKDPAEFHRKIDAALENPEAAKEMGSAGLSIVRAKFDTNILAKNVKDLYEELIEEKKR